MIKKIRSKLAVKVFIITLLLMTACCSVTYLCIARFAPYIYAHKLSDAEELGDMLSMELSYVRFDEIEYVTPFYGDILSRDYDDEFVFHIFKNSGEEVSFPYLDSLTGKRIEDYEDVEKTREYEISFDEGTGEYILFLTKNAAKESQIIEAIEKAFPILCVVVLTISVITASFYTWYITAPIKKVSRLSKQMAEMDFDGLNPVKRIDEIGVLSNNLKDLSAKLAAALSKLQESNQKLQADIDMERKLEKQRVEFFSAASHELKTPITIVKGQLQGMLYQVGRYKDREAYLAESLGVIETLEKMVQELLIISRLETTGYTCNKSNICLSMLVNDRLSAFEDLFMQKELSVEKSVTPEIYMSGDMQLLQKAVDNLLGNAVQYSKEGSSISVNLWKEDERINLTIENTGSHIPNEDIPKLFEAFYRVEQSRNRLTGGSGLGLYIVKTILELHDAEIRIANTIQGVIVLVQF